MEFYDLAVLDGGIKTDVSCIPPVIAKLIKAVRTIFNSINVLHVKAKKN